MKTVLKNKRIWLVAAAAVVAVAVLLAAGMLQRKENAPEPAATLPAQTEPAETVQPETQAATEATEAPAEEVFEEGIVEFANNEIQTPWLTLYYPEAFSDLLVVANTGSDPYVLEFYAMLEDRPEQRIFDVRMGMNFDGNMGIVRTAEGDISVDLTIYAFKPEADWSQGEIDTVLAMQDAANDMLERLDLMEAPKKQDKPVVEQEKPESSIHNTGSIETPYCTLEFPVIWEEYLLVEQKERPDGVCQVDFYGKVGTKRQRLLFTVFFGGDEGDQLGAILTDDGGFVTVNLQMEEPDLTGWKDAEAEVIYAMQEAVNEMIARIPLETN